MPFEHLLDKLIGCFRYAPFKCRACRHKFYRRPAAVSQQPAPAVERAPARNVAVCHRDPADTLRRVEQIIRVAGGTHLRRG